MTPELPRKSRSSLNVVDKLNVLHLSFMVVNQSEVRIGIEYGIK